MRRIVAIVGWLAAAAAATATGLAAVDLIGTGITGSAEEVYSQERIARELASPAAPSTPAPSATAPSGAAGSPVPGPRRPLETPGGVIVAQCVGSDVELTSWTPEQGYQVREVDRGPDDEGEISFDGPDGEVEVKVRCTTGQPTATWEIDD